MQLCKQTRTDMEHNASSGSHTSTQCPPHAGRPAWGPPWSGWCVWWCALMLPSPPWPLNIRGRQRISHSQQNLYLSSCVSRFLAVTAGWHSLTAIPTLGLGFQPAAHMQVIKQTSVQSGKQRKHGGAQALSRACSKGHGSSPAAPRCRLALGASSSSASSCSSSASSSTMASRAAAPRPRLPPACTRPAVLMLSTLVSGKAWHTADHLKLAQWSAAAPWRPLQMPLRAQQTVNKTAPWLTCPGAAARDARRPLAGLAGASSTSSATGWLGAGATEALRPRLGLGASSTPAGSAAAGACAMDALRPLAGLAGASSAFSSDTAWLGPGATDARRPRLGLGASAGWASATSAGSVAAAAACFLAARLAGSGAGCACLAGFFVDLQGRAYPVQY